MFFLFHVIFFLLFPSLISVNCFNDIVRVLFEGDSITDGFRDKKLHYPDAIMGNSYPLFVAAHYGSTMHQSDIKYEFFNRAIADSEFFDVIYQKRFQQGVDEVKPTVFSLLIGVYDVWVAVDNSLQLDKQKYETSLLSLVSELQKNHPLMDIVLIEPFICPGLKTMEKWKEWDENIRAISEIITQIVSKHLHSAISSFSAITKPSVTKIQTRKTFNELVSADGCDYWLFDGIHPTEAGKKILADLWIFHYENVVKPMHSNVKGLNHHHHIAPTTRSFHQHYECTQEYLNNPSLSTNTFPESLISPKPRCRYAEYFLKLQEQMELLSNTSVEWIMLKSAENLYSDLENNYRSDTITLTTSDKTKKEIKIHPISFCIPEENIVNIVPPKMKSFGRVIPGRKSTYFGLKEEHQYYEDMKHSLFTFTHKKAGWDCLRHLEILGEGYVKVRGKRHARIIKNI